MLPVLDGVRVLLVDDDETQCEMYVLGLRMYGARASFASTADTAVAALEREPFDVMVCDVVMPERGGFEIVRALREAGNRIPAIAITGLSGEQDYEAATAAGFDAYCEKPCTPRQLAVIVAKLCAARSGE